MPAPRRRSPIAPHPDEPGYRDGYGDSPDRPDYGDEVDYSTPADYADDPFADPIYEDDEDDGYYEDPVAYDEYDDDPFADYED